MVDRKELGPEEFTLTSAQENAISQVGKIVRKFKNPKLGHVVIISGLPGVGKTTIEAELESVLLKPWKFTTIDEFSKGGTLEKEKIILTATPQETFDLEIELDDKTAFNKVVVSGMTSKEAALMAERYPQTHLDKNLLVKYSLGIPLLLKTFLEENPKEVERIHKIVADYFGSIHFLGSPITKFLSFPEKEVDETLREIAKVASDEKMSTFFTKLKQEAERRKIPLQMPLQETLDIYSEEASGGSGLGDAAIYILAPNLTQEQYLNIMEAFGIEERQNAYLEADWPQLFGVKSDREGIVAVNDDKAHLGPRAGSADHVRTNVLPQVFEGMRGLGVLPDYKKPSAFFAYWDHKSTREPRIKFGLMVETFLQQASISYGVINHFSQIEYFYDKDKKAYDRSVQEEREAVRLILEGEDAEGVLIRALGEKGVPVSEIESYIELDTRQRSVIFDPERIRKMKGQEILDLLKKQKNSKAAMRIGGNGFNIVRSLERLSEGIESSIFGNIDRLRRNPFKEIARRRKGEKRSYVWSYGATKTIVELIQNQIVKKISATMKGSGDLSFDRAKEVLDLVSDYRSLGIIAERIFDL